MKYSLAVNSVGLIVSHESTGVSYRWLKSARILLWIVQLTFRYLDQIRLDVIESGVLVQHLYRCWWIVIDSGTSTAFSRWFKASSLWLFCDSATVLHISVLHYQQLLLLTDFGYSLSSVELIDPSRWRICFVWLNIDPRWRRSSVLAWTDSETSRERVPRRTAAQILLSPFTLSSSRSACVRALIMISISLYPSNLHLNPSYIS